MSDNAAHLDPVKVRAFAQDLQGTVAYYKRVIDMMESRLGQLGKTWRDQEYEAFVGEVKNLKRGLTTYIEEANAAHARLLHLATEAENYQKIQVR